MVRVCPNLQVTFLEGVLQTANVNGDSSLWNHRKINGEWHYERASLPKEYRNQFTNFLSAAQRKEAQILVALEEALQKANYNKFQNLYKGDSQEELCKAASLLSVIAGLVQEKKYVARQVYRVAEAFISENSVRRIPSCYSKLRPKVLALKSLAIDQVITLPRIGNTNAAKSVVNQEVFSWLVLLRSKPQNWTDAYIIRRVNDVCNILGQKAPSESWMKDQLAGKKIKYLTGALRFGDRGQKGLIYTGYIPTSGAVFAGDCWQVDGTRVNLLPFAVEGKSDKCLYNICVRDMYSGDILGVHYCLAEDRWGYIAALEAAVKTAGYLPYQIVIDRFPGHNTQEWQRVRTLMEQFGVRFVESHKGQGKSQLERWFSTFQSVFLADSSYYYGEGVKSSRAAAHRSAEYLSQMRSLTRKDGWTMAMAIHEASEALNRFRNTPYSHYSRKQKMVSATPMQLHHDSEKPHVIRIPEFRYSLLFHHQTTVTMRREGLLRAEYDGVEFLFIVDDFEIMSSYHSERMSISFDPIDGEFAYVFPEGCNTGQYEPLTQAPILNRIQTVGPDADGEGIARIKKHLKKIKMMREAALEEIVSGGRDIELLMAGMGKKEALAEAETEDLLEKLDKKGRRILSEIPAAPPPPEVEDSKDDLLDYVRSLY